MSTHAEQLLRDPHLDGPDSVPVASCGRDRVLTELKFAARIQEVSLVTFPDGKFYYHIRVIDKGGPSLYFDTQDSSLKPPRVGQWVRVLAVIEPEE